MMMGDLMLLEKEVAARKFSFISIANLQ